MFKTPPSSASASRPTRGARSRARPRCTSCATRLWRRSRTRVSTPTTSRAWRWRRSRARYRGGPRLEARPVAALAPAGHQRRLVGDEHARPRAARRSRPARPTPSSSSAATPPGSPATPRLRRTTTPRRRNTCRRSATAARTASMRWWRAARSRNTAWKNPTTATSPSRNGNGRRKIPRGLSRAADDGGVSRRALGGRSAVALRLRAGGGGRAGDHRGAARPRAEGPAGRARPRPSRELQLRQPGGRRAADRHQHLRRRAGGRPAAPGDIDVASIYDDYPTMVLAQANDLGLIPGHDLARFCRVTIGEERVSR